LVIIIFLTGKSGNSLFNFFQRPNGQKDFPVGRQRYQTAYAHMIAVAIGQVEIHLKGNKAVIITSFENEALLHRK